MVWWRWKKKSPEQAKTQAPAQQQTEQKPAEAAVVTVTAAPPCHTDPTEVYPGLFLGRKGVWREVTDPKKPATIADVLVPLNDLPGEVWNKGWRGEIIYCPIIDFDCLPQDVLARHVQQVLDRLAAGKRVAVFCQGGHGRTGYFAAALLGHLMPEEDPIDYLRRNYCEKAVETEEQIASLAEYLQRPELLKHEPTKFAYAYDYYGDWWSSYGTSTAMPKKTVCRECLHAYWQAEGWQCGLGRAPSDDCPKFEPWDSHGLQCLSCTWDTSKGCALGLEPADAYCEAYEKRTPAKPGVGVALNTSERS